ncbi:MAG: GAF domain-containing protein [Candidatus Eisenbacteria bacterium]|uniref:GAF domain-containing protein n=2 Tax=Eiseniibacteriota bacterium TaxID=2212470 RepID=A0A538SY27_UNCEI|nr:MAG: GAF domain-containing protein [Candidatus Eisenbacteria bacterium]
MNERATLAGRATSHEERLQFLVRASRELALLKRDELARKARDLLLRASGGFTELSLWVLDPRSEVLYPWTLCNTPVLGRRPRLNVGQGIAGQACAEEDPAFYPTISEAQYVPEEWGGRPRSMIQGVLTLPLKRAGEPLGVAVLTKLDSTRPPEEDLSFLRELSIQLAIAVGNSRIYAEATREKVQNHLLLELGTKISVSLDTNQLLEQILDLVFQVVRYDAAGIYLVDKKTQWINQQAIRGYDPNREDAVRLKVGRGLIGWVAKTGRPVIVPDVLRDERYVSARTQTRSEMVAPLRVGSEVIGAFNVESDEPDAYEPEDLELLMTFASQAAVAIERTRLHAEVLETRSLEEELSIGQRIQRTFLPERDPKVPNFDIAGANYSSGLVGGDYYDYVRITEGQLGIVVADVSGKGIPAALIMAAFRASLIAEVRNNYAIRTIFAKVNKLLWESVEVDRFVTAIYGVLDINARRFTYVNAGHNPGLLYRGATDTLDTLDSTGPLLGTLETATFKEKQVEIRRGDVLALYTDGITESMNEAKELFGEDRLRDVIRSRKEGSAAEIVRGIRETVGAFSGGESDDDLTVVVIKGM